MRGIFAMLILVAATLARADKVPDLYRWPAQELAWAPAPARSAEGPADPAAATLYLAADVLRRAAESHPDPVALLVSAASLVAELETHPESRWVRDAPRLIIDWHRFTNLDASEACEMLGVYEPFVARHLDWRLPELTRAGAEYLLFYRTPELYERAGDPKG